MFCNILVAFDGSPHADEALTEAIRLAQCTNARLTLMTGPDELPASAYPSWTDPDAPLMEDPVGQAETLLRRARERVPDELSVTMVLATEPIRTALMRQIEAGGHDLLAIGAAGGGVRVDSVTDHALRHSPVSVLAARAAGTGTAAPPRLKHARRLPSRATPARKG